MDALAERMATPGIADDFVFTGPQGGTLRVSLFPSRVWRPATRVADLDGLCIHDLRHTAVALWIAAGANYGHLFPEADLMLRERLEAIYAASTGEL